MTLVAYCRLFNAGDYFDNPSIGRVVISSKYRDRKWGHDLMSAAIAAIQEHYNYFCHYHIGTVVPQKIL